MFFFVLGCPLDLFKGSFYRIISNIFYIPTVGRNCIKILKATGATIRMVRQSNLCKTEAAENDKTDNRQPDSDQIIDKGQ